MSWVISLSWLLLLFSPLGVSASPKVASVLRLGTEESVVALPPKTPSNEAERWVGAFIKFGYSIAENRSGTRLVLEADPSAQTNAHLPAYRIDLRTGNRAQLREWFKRGRIDVLTQPTTDDAIRNPKARLAVSPLWSTRVLLPNLSRPIWQSRSLRKQLSAAMDRRSLVAQLGDGERAANGLFPDGTRGYHSEPAPTGIEGRGPAPREICPTGTLNLLTEPGPKGARIGALIQAQLERWSGCKVKTVLGASATTPFDLAIRTLIFSQTETPELFDLLKEIKWSHASLRSLLEGRSGARTGSETTLDLQIAAFLENQEVPLIHLTHPVQSFLLNPRILEFGSSPTGIPLLDRITVSEALSTPTKSAKPDPTTTVQE